MGTRAARLAVAAVAVVAVTNVLCLPNPKDTWVRLDAPHFVVFSNANTKQATKIATQLEQFRAVLQGLTGGTNLDAEVPTYVYIFRSQSSMKPYKSEGERAYFVGTDYGNYIALNARPATGGVVRDNPYTLFPYKDTYHEYVHFVLNNSSAIFDVLQKVL